MENRCMMHTSLRLLLLSTTGCLALAGCGGSRPPPPAGIAGIRSTPAIPRGRTVSSASLFAIGGSSDVFHGVLGLLNNGSDALQLRSPGPFVFAQRVPAGAPYAVTIDQQPPARTCVVLDGSGTAAANVSTIRIVCQPASMTVLHDFAATPADALSPSGPLAQGPQGRLYGIASSGGANGVGGIYAIDLQGRSSMLYSFQAAGEGVGPGYRLAFGSGGSLYGVSPGVAVAGDLGAVFRLAPDGTYSVLHSFLGFTGGQDGATPSSGLVRTADGDFYGMTRSGGANNTGTLFRIAPGGAFSTVYSFPPTGGGGLREPSGQLFLSADGGIYGTAARGSKSGSPGGIFRFDPGTGQVRTVATLQVLAATPSSGVVETAPGVFYGIARSRATPGQNLLFQVLVPSAGGSAAVTQAAALPPSSKSSLGTGALLQASDGRLYGLLPYADGGNGALYVFDPSNQQLRVLYGFSADPTTVGTVPMGGLLLGSDGRFYGATSSGGPSAGSVFVFG